MSVSIEQRRTGEAPLDPEGIAPLLGVSRETVARLEHYLALLAIWQRAINLVGKSTLSDPWRRHILDSAQLCRFLPQRAVEVADLGSGAGLPGLILAITTTTAHVHLVEADGRKAQFLREVARRLDLANVTVHAARIENVTLRVDVVTARALAPLAKLLPLAAPLLAPDGRMVFLKGANGGAELAEARAAWSMREHSVPSLADPDGRVVILDEVRRRAQ
jgi:16S rRNA (guanine527-N7)-methyltransferase